MVQWNRLLKLAILKLVNKYETAQKLGGESVLIFQWKCKLDVYVLYKEITFVNWLLSAHFIWRNSSF